MDTIPLIRADMLDNRVSFERGMRRFPFVILSLIGANLAVFGLQIGKFGLKTKEALLASGALDRSLVFSGEAWRIVSANFLHADLGHLLGNLIILFIIGLAAIHLFGSAWTLLIYSLSGIIAMTASLALSSITLGASGAIFGLVGAVGACLYHHRHHFQFNDRRLGLVLVVWSMYSIVMAGFDPNINNLAHAAGLLVGVALGRYRFPRPLVLPQPGATIIAS